MSHGIEKNSDMIYVGDTPWHRLGIALTNAPSVDDALKLTGLDWTVRLEALETTIGGIKVEHQAVIRNDCNRVLGVVGPEWRPLQNREVFSVLEPFINAKVCEIETAGAIFGGKRVWALARLASTPIVVAPGDEVQKFMLVCNGHDGSLTCRVGFTPIRVVCNNTLGMAVARGASRLVRIKHTAGASKALDLVKSSINAAEATFEATAEKYALLAKSAVHADDLKKYFRLVFPPKPVEKIAPAQPAQPEQLAIPTAIETPALDSILSENYMGVRAASLDEIADETQEQKDARCVSLLEELFETGRGSDLRSAKGTLWGAFNAVSEYVTHYRGRSDEGRANAMFAESGKVLDRALNAAVKMATC